MSISVVEVEVLEVDALVLLAEVELVEVEVAPTAIKVATTAAYKEPAPPGHCAWYWAWAETVLLSMDKGWPLRATWV